MKNKRPFIYLGLAIIAALIVLILEDPFSPRVNDATESCFIPNYDSADVFRIEVEQLIDGAQLKRSDKDWMVADLTTPLKRQLYEKEGRDPPPPIWEKADNLRVRSALAAFGGMGEGILVSGNPGKQSAYQVGLTGVHVRTFDENGNSIFDIVIGKNGPDFASNYVRRGDDDNVYLVKKPLVGIFSPRPEDWEEKKIDSEPASEKR